MFVVQGLLWQACSWMCPRAPSPTSSLLLAVNFHHLHSILILPYSTSPAPAMRFIPSARLEKNMAQPPQCVSDDFSTGFDSSSFGGSGAGAGGGVSSRARVTSFTSLGSVFAPGSATTSFSFSRLLQLRQIHTKPRASTTPGSAPPFLENSSRKRPLLGSDSCPRQPWGPQHEDQHL